MFAEGLMLMVLGMSVVFLFLGLLVLTIKATSFVLRKISGKETEEKSPAREDKAAIAAVIVSAIDHSRNMSMKAADRNG